VDPVGDAEAPRHVLHVLLDLGLVRVAVRPVRVRRERELIQVRRHVAPRAGIRVVVPDAADPLAALEHRHVVVARPSQHDRGADAAKATSDHCDRSL